MRNPVFEGERKEKGKKNLGFARKSGLGWLCFPILAPKRSNNMEEEI